MLKSREWFLPGKPNYNVYNKKRRIERTRSDSMDNFDDLFGSSSTYQENFQKRFLYSKFIKDLKNEWIQVREESLDSM